ncbi:HlyD family efflux transporter periplasmic adaptor subunit [Dickeya lacustris]|uniref:HlyD family efflux transporter periplasmic adaptor subunit n=1 Tax=Dickeya lacustris TaxID=2259638 RepID=A0ABY8GAJ3_9GAMM|nr:HlyD family efflux transporter periplasmic adaptor subunit [Dickeya lacustris]WFN56923.1 HlyD family efflux transporter periplasmic adaptor subunit [Dickeya lacustris]
MRRTNRLDWIRTRFSERQYQSVNDVLAEQNRREDIPARLRLSTWVIVAFSLFLIIWAAFIELDEVVRVKGKTAYQSKYYNVQATQGGGLSDIYVHEGQIINTGDPLMRLENNQRALSGTHQDKTDQLFLIMSPIKGIISRLLVNSTTEQIQRGQTLAEITPLDDKLLIEAQVRPQDIDFLRPGQDATVTFTAYDYTLYGSVKAVIDVVQPEMMTSPSGDNFYLIRLHAEKNYLGNIDKPLLILPGMAASIDIVSGRKTLLSYLFLPIQLAKKGALHEK